MSKRYFELPDENKADISVAMVKRAIRPVIEAVPDTWRMVRGHMEASQQRKQSERVLKDVQFVVNRRYDAYDVIDSSTNDRGLVSPEIVRDVLFGRKMPSRVIFKDAAYDRPSSDCFALVKSTVLDLLDLGYRGSVTFVDGRERREHFDETLACTVHLAPWDWGTGFRIRPGQMQPPCVELRWAPELGGKEDDLAPIEAVCRELKLIEFEADPQARALGA